MLVQLYESNSPEETFEIAFEMGKNAKPGDVFCLNGDLGVGKTIFAKGFAKGLEIEDCVNSPTFTIVSEYEGRIPLYHFDVYRIGDEEEMFEIGCEEYFYGNGVCLIEWAELIKSIIPDKHMTITIEKDLDKGLDYRKIELNNN